MTYKKDYRPEIDGLRGIAVIAVIINHFFGDTLASGFLGVDVFFVISGYVITSYLSKTGEDNWFDYLVNFYSRRVKRLLPALLVCVFLTNALFLLLAPNPSKEIFKTGYFALIGFSNVFLYNSANNYFSLDAQLNPFTQTWSLGVEEQFYLVFPIILAFLGYGGRIAARPTAARFSILIGLTVVSFCAYLLTNFISQMAAFYLMPTRFWELSIGVLTFLVANNKSLNLTRRKLGAVFCFFAILLVFFLPYKFQIFTTIGCVGLTAGLLLLIKKGDLAYRILSTKILVFIGMISYSLYLWHWSVLVLGKWTIGNEGDARFVLLMIAVLLAVLSYYLIEKPIRYRVWKVSNPIAPILVGGASIFVVVLVSVYAVRIYLVNYDTVLASFYKIPKVYNWAENLECHGQVNVEKYTNPYEHCLGGRRASSKPYVVYLIGDSHAAQLVFMMRKALQNSPYELKFINTEDSKDFPQAFMSSPNAQSKTLDFILKNARKLDIVAVSFHRGHLNDSRDEHIPLQKTVNTNEKTGNFYLNSERYFQLLDRLGVKVLLIRDTPLMSVTATSSSCLLQVKMFGRSVCRVAENQDLHTRYRQDYLYSKLHSNLRNVYTWDPQSLMYGENEWVDVVDSHGEYIMMDWNHITKYESEKLAENFSVFFRDLTQSNPDLLTREVASQ